MLSGMHCIVYNTLSAIFIFMIIFLLLWLIFIIMITCICTILHHLFLMCCLHMVTLSQSKFIVLNLYRLSLCDQVTKFDKFWTLIKTNLNQNKQKTLWKYDNLMVKNLHSPEFGCKKNHENYFFCFMDL